MWLKYNKINRTFYLVNGNNVLALNSALEEVKSTIDYEYKGGQSASVTIKIENDEVITIGVGAVKVNGERIISKSLTTSSGHLKINYDNAFYDGIAPCFIFGEFINIETKECVPPKKRYSWDD